MKKFICSLLLVCLAAVFAGCGSSDTPKLPDTVKNGEWFEVQSVTYCSYTSAQYTYTSRCKYEYEQQIATKEEYDNASDKQKDFSIGNLYDFSINRKVYLDDFKYWSNNPYYRFIYNYIDYEQYEEYYYKYVLKNYEFYYVRVRFLDNNCFEINYNNYNETNNYNATPQDYNTTIRVSPLSYKITYFND